jgi:hypothetical protein
VGLEHVRMTDSELLAAQHRVILNMPCSCKLAWKNSAEQPLGVEHG